MAQTTQCISSPTLTSTGVSTSHSLSTTTTRTISTVPGPVLTTTVRACSVINTNTTTCGVSTSLVTGTGTVTTNDVVLTVTVDVPVSYQATLYGSVCSTIYTDAPIRTTTSSTPTPSISTITSSSIVTSDGSTYLTVFTSTTASLPTATQESSSSSTNIPVIVGGVLGGISALVLVALLAWHLLKKKAPFHDDDFMNDTTTTDPFQKNPAPDFYQYNPVAQQDTQAVGNSFPNSPAAQGFGNNAGPFNSPMGNEPGGQYGGMGNTPMTNNIGMQPGATGNDVMYNLPNQLPVHNLQNPPLAPLLVGGAAAAAGALAARQTRPTTTSSSGSDFPLIGYAQQYPPALATYPQQQAYGPAQVGHPNLVHSLSVGSTTASAYSASSSNPRTSGVDFVPMAMAQPGQYPQQQYVQMPHPRYDNGPYSQPSSTSANAQDNALLQVRNPEPEMSAQNSSGTPGLSVVGSSSSAAQSDGKGRPLNTMGEKAAFVHLDGGAYQVPSTPAPPAYME